MQAGVAISLAMEEVAFVADQDLQTCWQIKPYCGEESSISVTICQLQQVGKCAGLFLKEPTIFAQVWHKIEMIVRYRMHKRTSTLLITDPQVTLELGIHLQKCQVPFNRRFNQIRLGMWLHILSVAAVVSMIPVFPPTCFFLLQPMRNEQVLTLAQLVVVYLRKGPLVGVGAGYGEIQEAFLCGLGYPVQVEVACACSFPAVAVWAKCQSMGSKVLISMPVDRVVVVFFDELGLKQFRYALLLRHLLLFFQVLLIVLPWFLFKVYWLNFIIFYVFLLLVLAIIAIIVFNRALSRIHRGASQLLRRLLLHWITSLFWHLRMPRWTIRSLNIFPIHLLRRLHTSTMIRFLKCDPLDLRNPSLFPGCPLFFLHFFVHRFALCLRTCSYNNYKCKR